jgi:hypothetical protein
MKETIQLGEVTISVTRKDIKNVHLSVHPPNSRVTLAAPSGTRIGFGSRRTSWRVRRGKHLASSSSGRVTISGGGGT